MVLLAGLVLVLGPGRDFACLASDDAGTRAVRSPSTVETGFVDAQDADWKTFPSVEHTRYGYSVASVGNVDGREGEDVVVGAPQDGTLGGGGAAYLYLSTGGALSPTHDWSATQGEQGADFGWSVAGAGDVNGDTYDDVVIGAKDHKAVLVVGENPVKVGRVFVYQGVPGVGLTIDHTWSYTGTVKEGEFASAVAGAGDVNGDGIDDVVVGARWYSDEPETDPGKHSGAVYVFYGSHDGPSVEPDWLIPCPQAGAWFGASVSAGGDVNHDGYDDLIVGAPGYLNPDSGVPEGAALLFLGGESPPASVADAAWIVYGEQEDSHFGTVVAGAGDVNGDNYPDILVSTPDYRRLSDEVLVGAAYVFCGNGSDLDTDPCWKVTGSQPGAQFGASASGAGDVNGDGFDEVIVGAPYYTPDPEAGYEGAAFLYFGSEEGPSTWPRWKAGGDRSKTDFGVSVGSSGRILTGEPGGVIIGAPQYFISGTAYGGAFAFYGPLEPAELLPAAYLPLIMRNAN